MATRPFVISALDVMAGENSDTDFRIGLTFADFRVRLWSKGGLPILLKEIRGRRESLSASRSGIWDNFFSVRRDLVPRHPKAVNAGQEVLVVR